MTNPFFETWTTPFGLPPFDLIGTEQGGGKAWQQQRDEQAEKKRPIKHKVGGGEQARIGADGLGKAHLQKVAKSPWRCWRCLIKQVMAAGKQGIEVG